VLHPDQWVTGYPACGGNKQSPIDFIHVPEVKEPKNPLQFSGHCSEYVLHKLPETLKWEAVNSTCKVHLKGKSYSLKQFHIHTGSEHKVNGKQYDSEVHFVHQEDELGEDYLVLGLFIEASDQVADYEEEWMNDALESVVELEEDIASKWDESSEAEATSDSSSTSNMNDEEHNAEDEIQFSGMPSYAHLVKSKIMEHGVMNYEGSLTTPPCTEAVNWWVVRSPIHVSSSHLASFAEKVASLEEIPYNARPIQPLNGRQIHLY